MSANRTQLFYQELTPAASFNDANSFQYSSGKTSLKIIAETADIEFSVNGEKDNSIDGVVKAGETITWEEFEHHRIAFKGAGATVRVWAWK